MGEEQNSNTNNDAEKLLQRLEKQLGDLDTEEFLADMTSEILAEKGFIGETSITIERAENRQSTEKEHLTFEPGVEFERLPDTALFEDLQIEFFLHLSDVQKGQFIASRSVDEHLPFSNGKNVVKDEKDGLVRFYATGRGKPVIIKDALHILLSDVDCYFAVNVDKKQMNVMVSCKPPYGEGRRLFVGLIKDEMKRQGILFGIDNEAIQCVVSDVNLNRISIIDRVIATGKKPVAGEPGTIEYAFDKEKKEYDFTILPDGKIDYRSSKSILTVDEGQLLAKIKPPTTGTPGRTVCGETVTAKDGSPARLVAGIGVHVAEDGATFYAAIAGCVVLNGSLIEVVNTYVIDGDVDFSTGNINFNGNVLIFGTVPDGFEVKAVGDIVVLKVVESAKLEAGRDVIIKGGVLGRGKGLVSAGRDVRVGYAQNARIEAQGSIYVENYAVNSYMATSKSLVMQEKRGTIIGGEVFALRGIDVKNLGSENGAKTYIEVGTDFLVLRKIREMDEVIAFCEKNVDKITGALRTIVGKLLPGNELPAHMKQPMAKAIEKKHDLEQKMLTMRAKRSDLQCTFVEMGTCFVKVKDTCFTDVTIKVRDPKLLVNRVMKGVRFFEDRKSGIVKANSYKGAENSG